MMRRAFSLVAAVSLAMTGTMIVPGAAAFDPTDPADALGDTDGDGLTNLQEFALRTDIDNPDSDFGGAPDGWEVQYGLDPRNSDDDWADTDGDGWSNREEYARGTDPLDPDTDGDGVVDSVDPHPLFPDCDWSATTSCSNELGH